jgi:hypothetical protein
MLSGIAGQTPRRAWFAIYTLSHRPTSNTSSIFDPRNFLLDYGNGNQNIPNRAIATAIITSPWEARGWLGNLLNDYELAHSFSVQNGAPYTASITGNPTTLVASGSATGFVTGVSSGYTGTGGSSRIPGLQRNTFSQPPTILLDLRASKHFVVRERYRLEFLAEAFNLLNHQNVTAVNTTAYTLGTTTVNGVNTNTLTRFLASPFGAATNSNNNNIYTPRQLQLGVRLEF